MNVLKRCIYRFYIITLGLHTEKGKRNQKDV